MLKCFFNEKRAAEGRPGRSRQSLAPVSVWIMSSSISILPLLPVFVRRIAPVESFPFAGNFPACSTAGHARNQPSVPR